VTRLAPGTAMAARVRRAAPGTHWVVATVLLGVFVSLLMVPAYMNAKFAPDGAHTVGVADQVPPSIADGGPIIDTTRGETRSFRLPPKTIALTFDDGPDPRWTPWVTQALRRHGVKATFFVVGSQVSRYSGLVRELAGAGHEIGVHSFTHPYMAELPRWRQELEYSQTQLAIVNATGRKAVLLRLPYSSSADAIDNVNWALIRDAGQLGYLSVVMDTDSNDWRRPGVDAIVRNSTPAGDQGAVVLMHDAGGDRGQTVAALDRFIPLMQQRGYRFTTVSEGLASALAQTDRSAAPVIAGNPPASEGDQHRALALVATIRIGYGLLFLLNGLFVLVGLLTFARTVALFTLARRHARGRRAADWRWGPPVTLPVSVVVPAYNEKAGIAAAVRSLAGGDHDGGIEVVVVDDGSTDGTADIVQELGLPNARVVRTPNRGKPSALNTGIAMARHELIIMVDGDTVFEPDSVRQLVQPFADPSVGAVAGNVKVGNRSSVLARWQHIEYVIGFALDRRLYDLWQCMPTVPGAIGAFRRAALHHVGGMSDDTLAEDTDITMALLRAGWRVVYEERACAWTEAPTTLGQLWLQRYRWSYGTMQAMWKHRRSVIERGPSGRFGRIGLPFVALFAVTLPLLAPLIDILTVYGLLFLDRTDTAIAWLAMLGLQVITAVVAFRLDRERLRPLWALPLQQFAYRQLMYLVLLRSAVTALAGTRLRWHKLHRSGSAGEGAPASADAPTPAAIGVPALRGDTRTPANVVVTQVQLPHPRRPAQIPEYTVTAPEDPSN
jgi:cellulose synthase/poly-beta-1,6-N-acetylglucosamine synthase-like glycosyltransferase/peptidoglycan/xylan/chitin deacetylase (PgdA/CDA1 family)